MDEKHDIFEDEEIKTFTYDRYVNGDSGDFLKTIAKKLRIGDKCIISYVGDFKQAFERCDIRKRKYKYRLKVIGSQGTLKNM